MRKKHTSFFRCPAIKFLAVFPLFFSLIFAWPLTTNGAFGDFTIKDEAELGRKFNILVRSRLPLVLDPEIVAYVEKVVNRLSAGLPQQIFPFQVSVIRHNAVNAFATPGGYVFVHTGLIMAMEHESELAGVLAHEMAHVTQRHVAHNIEKSQKMGIFALLGMLAGAFLGGDAGQAAIVGSMAATQTAMLNYSRSDESDADQVGIGYLIAAGYPPQGLVDSFKILQQKQWTAGGSEIPSYLSTHPAMSTRISDLQARINALPLKLRQRKNDDAEFLRIQALVRANFSDPAPAKQAFMAQLDGPNRCNALMGLGILSGRINEVKEGEDYFEQALACSPKSELIMREAGVFNYTRGNSAKGAKYLQQAVLSNPGDYIAKFFLARMLSEGGNNKDASRYYREILNVLPEDSEVHYYYAQSLGQEKKLFEAHLHMAYCYLYANNKPKTKQYSEKAKEYALNADEKAKLGRFEKIYKERSEFW